jgi:hypothetical protein
VIVVTLYLNEDKNALSQNSFGCSLLYVVSEISDGIIFKTLYVSVFWDELTLLIIAKYFF